MIDEGDFEYLGASEGVQDIDHSLLVGVAIDGNVDERFVSGDLRELFMEFEPFGKLRELAEVWIGFDEF